MKNKKILCVLLSLLAALSSPACILAADRHVPVYDNANPLAECGHFMVDTIKEGLQNAARCAELDMEERAEENDWNMMYTRNSFNDYIARNGYIYDKVNYAEFIAVLSQGPDFQWNTASFANYKKYFSDVEKLNKLYQLRIVEDTIEIEHTDTDPETGDTSTWIETITYGRTDLYKKYSLKSLYEFAGVDPSEIYYMPAREEFWRDFLHISGVTTGDLLDIFEEGIRSYIDLKSSDFLGPDERTEFENESETGTYSGSKTINFQTASRSALFSSPLAMKFTSSSGTLSNSAVAKIIWDYCKQKGMGEVNIAALIGNFEGECSLDPGENEIGGTGKGLGQWSNTKTSRRGEKFINYMSQHGGYNSTNIIPQLDFLFNEEGIAQDGTVKNPGAPERGYWIAGKYKWSNPPHTSIAKSFAEFMTLDYSSVEDAVLDYYCHWEIPGYSESSIKRRIGAAYAALEMFGSGGNFQNRTNGGGKISIEAGSFYGGIGLGSTGYQSSIRINPDNYSIPQSDSNNKVPYFGQGNKDGGSAWAGLPFSYGTIATSGCSITSLSMVLSYLNGAADKSKWIYPCDVLETILKLHNNNPKAFSPDGTVSWEIMDGVAGHYGVSCTEISYSAVTDKIKQGKSYFDAMESVNKALLSGHPVIASTSGPNSKTSSTAPDGSKRLGLFTQNGHFIVITGLDNEGNYYVNNPSNNTHNGKKFSAYELWHESKAFWTFALEKTIAPAGSQRTGARRTTSAAEQDDDISDDDFDVFSSD